MVVEGIKTNIPLHRRILEDADFVAGRFNTGFLDRFLGPKKRGPGGRERPRAARRAGRGGSLAGSPFCSFPSPC